MKIINSRIKSAAKQVLALTVAVACTTHVNAQIVSRIVFQANVASAKRASYSQIFSMNHDGSGVTQLTSSSTNSYRPRWSPGQQYISFCRAGQVCVMQGHGEANGGSSFVVAPASIYGSDWSPDGSKLAFIALNDGGLYIIPVNPSAGTAGLPVLLRKGYWYNPSWSPDGTKIVANGSDNGSANIIVVFDASTGAELAAFGADPSSNFAPQWSPSGAEIAFSGQVTLTTIGKNGRATTSSFQQIFLANPDGTGMTQITSWNRDSLWPAWSPDGTALAFDSNGGIYNLLLGGSTPTVLVSGGSSPDWNP